MVFSLYILKLGPEILTFDWFSRIQPSVVALLKQNSMYSNSEKRKRTLYTRKRNGTNRNFQGRHFSLHWPIVNVAWGRLSLSELVLFGQLKLQRFFGNRTFSVIAAIRCRVCDRNPECQQRIPPLYLCLVSESRAVHVVAVSPPYRS